MADQRGLAVVAVSFASPPDAVVATATSLARRFPMGLRFVHVVTPAQDADLAWQYSASTASFVFPPYVPIEDDLQVEEARQQMRDLIGSLPPQIRAEGVVLSGFAVPTIIAEAVAHKANLVITGCRPEAYSAVLGGFSTPLGLMHAAPLPVLTVSAASPLDFERTGLRLVLADDLQPSTLEAARKAYELAGGLNQAVVRQVHVHGSVSEVLRDAWKELQVTALAGADWGGTADDLLRRDTQARLGTLQARGEPERSRAVAAGAVCDVAMRTGNVPDELMTATSAFDANLVVFGRHQVLRARPFLIGRMPLRTMLAEKRPVLLVPPERDLYQRLPFPCGTA